MKISKLYIDQFRHLENLEFDFTYQSGERKGQPLDKICFIGQSATGKTGLLELIYDCLRFAIELEVDENVYTNEEINFNGEINFLFNKSSLKIKDNEVYFRKKKFTSRLSDKTNEFLISEDLLKDFFFFKANLISDTNINIFTNNPVDLIEKHSNELTDISNYYQTNNYGLIFDKEADPKIWLYLIHDILEYRKNFTQKMSELIHKGLIAYPEKLSSEFQKWQKNNSNQLDLFAEKFNPIIKKLNLEVDLVNAEYSIPIKNKKNDEIIPIQNTSTGTKGLLLSFLPLFKLETKDSIILIDEPERSLYPDMQMDLMDHYQNLAPKAQFIVATHSPFLAASFEPDERFILYFDNEGKVAVRRGSSPIGDDPNDMLYNDFGINYINKYGQEKYQEYLDLKQKIYFETDPKKKEEISEQLEKLGDEYNF
ncbi:AAA family ATPase [Flavobacterium sp. GN10]|uniref:AAA family ATPase n=1 Tax=Flavobacterium tagetis TaxID=2801336 RepID=A0ABS1KHC5_9FLAO|nr:AAA family ATPase [Flavobacterium tagetis]MBL0738770.1 AAA family ATPase [Flavobacterium tagetis]